MVISEKCWGVSNGVFLYYASTQAVRRVAHDPSNPGFWVVNYVCPKGSFGALPLDALDRCVVLDAFA